MRTITNQTKTQRLNLIVLPELTKRAESVSKRMKVSISEIVRRALSEYLDRIERADLEKQLSEGYQANSAYYNQQQEDWKHADQL
ncbi:MAG: ribbon-helix-helix domain-containing protein [Candidatus Marinimicrobia bacterium]|nr:ribbon-helix-helix domain-containing protein [Nanoarchaeota archaeon]MCG2715238.1 ribbon-helix-helix domain-containing protein [Candidatus Neomarinimicrobiota bacterium]